MLKLKKKKVEKKESKKDYHVALTFNFETIEDDVNDIKKYIMSKEPSFLRTNLIIKITNKEGKSYIKKYNAIKGRKIFWGKVDFVVFMRDIIFR